MLVLAFVIVGAVVYHATAPPPAGNERSFSFSRIVEHLRREMRGNRARAEVSSVTTHELDPTVTEVRLAGAFFELTITGEKRSNVEARLRVTSNGFDENEAKKLAGETRVKADRAGAALRLTSAYPQPGQQRAYLSLLVPAQMSVRIDQGGQKTIVSGVSAVEATLRGDTSLENITGRITLTHRAGDIQIDGAAALKLNARGSDAKITNVRGDASLSLVNGSVGANAISGPIDVDAQSADIELQNLDASKGPLRVNAVGGSVVLKGLKRDARIDGRNTEMEIALASAAPVAIYNEGDESITVTLPPDGFTLDALVTDGGLSLPDDLGDQVSVSGGDEDRERRATGTVRGGGPTITIRASHGSITLRPREAQKPAPRP